MSPARRPPSRFWPSLTFALLMGSLALLETTRDTTIVGADAVALLPWVYGFVALAVVTTELTLRRLARGVRVRRLLWVSLVGAAIGSLAAARLLPVVEARAAALLYGAIAFGGSAIAARFWAAVSADWTVEDAKRSAAAVSASGVGGALVGSWIARLSVGAIGLPGLAVLAAAGIVLGALALRRWPRAAASHEDAPGTSSAEARGAQDQPSVRYLFILFAFMSTGTIAVTAVDFVFKSRVAELVAPEELATFFATLYGVAYAVGLAVQIFRVPRVLDTVGVGRAILALPLVFSVMTLFGVLLDGTLALDWLGMGGVGVSLAVWTILKGIDAALRHAFHGTVVEIAHLAASAAARQRWRTLLDSLAQRGGQALAALLLGLSALGGAHFPSYLAVLAALGWAALAFTVGRSYVALLRARAAQGSMPFHFDSVTLDLSAVQALLRQLSSNDDARVLGALETLARHGDKRLVPTLVAYHPSPRIAARALDVFTSLGRDDHIHVARRLLEHADADVRAAAGRAIASAARSPEERRALAGAEAEVVRIAAMVACASAAELGDDELAELARLAASKADLRLAFARAAAQLPSPELTALLASLVPDADAKLGSELATALARCGGPLAVRPLALLLGRFGSRTAAFAAWAELGEAAVGPGIAIFDEDATPRVCRLHLPKALVLAGSRPAALAILERMDAERDAGVRYRMLVALGSHQAREPTTSLPAAPLEQALERTLQRNLRLIRYLDWVDAIDAADALGPLRVLLDNKVQEGAERVFRLLGLLFPEEDFARLFDGLRRGDAEARAAAREVLRHVLIGARAEAVTAIVGETSFGVRAYTLERALGASAVERPRNRHDLLALLLSDGSETIVALTIALLDDVMLPPLLAQLDAIAMGTGEAAEQARARLSRFDSPRVRIVGSG